MVKLKSIFQRLGLPFFLAVLLVGFWLGSLNKPAVTAATGPEAAPPAHIGYGFNVRDWDVSLLQSMGFDWMKVFSPPGGRMPIKVLIRVEADAQDLANLSYYGQQLNQLAQTFGDNIEAYEIGNEVNLDASYGWNAPPVAADYVTVLCVAYQNIKQADPDAIVISAGLAPTGRVQGTWQGHPGHNGLFQDERQFLIEFLAAGGANCIDALGYHPAGFSADYNAPPDVASTNPAQNCVNGFCFRGVEKIYQIMQASGHGDISIWATEFGWIVYPPAQCMSDPGWQGRAWQLVTEQKQASNLVGAFTYAEANYPWMAGMMVFNLNFNKPGAYPECEQMRYYAVENRPAEAALANMPKNPVLPGPEMTVGHTLIRQFVDVDNTPDGGRISFDLGNEGVQTMPYTLTLAGYNGVNLTFPQPTGQVGGGQLVPVQVLFQVDQPLGVYTASLRVDSWSNTVGAPRKVTVEVHVIPDVFEPLLPAVFKP